MNRDEKEFIARKGSDIDVVGLTKLNGELAKNAAISTMPIIFADAGGRGYRIQFVNDCFLRLMGLSRSEVIGQAFGALMSKHTSEDTLRNIGAALSKGQRTCLDVDYYNADALEIHACLFLSPIRNSDGQTESLLISILDITSRYDDYTNACKFVNQINEIVKSKLSSIFSNFRYRPERLAAESYFQVQESIRRRAAWS